MSLSELSSVRAVEQALDEFEALGRPAFLQKYGFGEARDYFVLRNGRLYDSKAIAGAAFGFQYPSIGPLKANQFSGGESTVKAKLEQLGFEVRHGGEGRGSASIEQAFDRRVIEVYLAAKNEAGYNATRFLAMVSQHGGLETARILVNAPSVSEGYTALWERGRLDLTVEALILEDAWSTLFSSAECAKAAKRLRDYGYTGAAPRS